MPKTATKSVPLKKTGSPLEYILVLAAFFALRFAFKNVLRFRDYFTIQPVFNLSDTYVLVAGLLVLAFVIVLLALFFERILRSCDGELEKPVILLIAFVLACPAAFPFLFDQERSNGAQLLYPFAVFVFGLFIAQKPIVKWIVPVVCTVYFVPVYHTDEVFFSVLHKSALLYVPLILLFLYLDTVKTFLQTGKKASADKQSQLLLIVSAVFSGGAYAYSYFRGYRWGDALFPSDQKISLYLLIALLIVSPTIIAFVAVMVNALKNKFPSNVFAVFWRAQIVLVFLFRNNLLSLWVPFLVLSAAMFVLCAVKAKNPAMLAAVKTVGESMLDRKFIVFMVLIAMASLTNVTSAYLSSAVQSVFSTLPY